MTMVEILQSIISLLTGGLVGVAEGLGKGITALVKNMFFSLSEQGAIIGLNEFGSIVVIFGGIALALGLGYKVYNLLVTMGGKR